VGVRTKESVEHEHAWRSNATALQRPRRIVGYAFAWLP